MHALLNPALAGEAGAACNCSTSCSGSGGWVVAVIGSRWFVVGCGSVEENGTGVKDGTKEAEGTKGMNGTVGVATTKN